MAKLTEIIDIASALEQNPSFKDEITGAYKAIFSGHPWHEDKICKNSLVKDKEGKPKCQIQFTAKTCDKFDLDRKKNEILNDCRDNYAKRDGIALLREGLETCVGCGDKLQTIDFYPSFVDHVELFREAVNEDGFIGFAGSDEKKLVGFSWGYRAPHKPTKAVRFDLINPMLEEKGIDFEKTFYASETGVLDTYQSGGIGTALSGKRLMEAKDQEYQTTVTRTINPLVHAYFEKTFGGKEGQLLFKDPERASSWFKWDFKDFDAAYIQRKILNALGK